MPNSIRIAYICAIVPVLRAERDNFNTLYINSSVIFIKVKQRLEGRRIKVL